MFFDTFFIKRLLSFSSPLEFQTRKHCINVQSSLNVLNMVIIFDSSQASCYLLISKQNKS